MMRIDSGTFMSFSTYLDAARLPQERPAVWRADATWHAARQRSGDARGSVALTRDDAHSSGEVAPGLSLTAQRVEHGVYAPLHRHSFWHLYIVQSGSGHIAIEDEANRLPIAPGDWVFVPAWCAHALDNRDGDIPLELFALQNLPQSAALGNLARADRSRPIELTYADA